MAAAFVLTACLLTACSDRDVPVEGEAAPEAASSSEQIPPPAATPGSPRNDATEPQRSDELAVTGDLALRVCWSTANGAGGASDPTQTQRPIDLVDVTEGFGLVKPLTGMLGHAFAAGDASGDGWIDLFVGTFADRPDETYQTRGADEPSPDRLLLGGPQGFLVDEGFPGTRARSSGAAFADLTGDGHLDLIVSRNPRSGRPGADPTIIYRNDGERLTAAATLLPTTRARAVVPFDATGEGRLDLFFVEDRWGGGSSRLLRNDGDLSFTDVTSQAGFPDDVHGLGAGVADLTGNGLPDLFVAGSNRLFVNGGDGTFREADAEVFAWDTFGAEDDVSGVAFGDLTRDGRLDLVLGHHYNSTVDQGERVAVRVYLNEGVDDDGAPRFRDVTNEAGLPGLATKAPHVELADLDNDGWPDLVTSASARDGREPAVFRHDGLVDGVPRFSIPEGLGSEQYWVTGGAVDLTRDGRLEIALVEWFPEEPSRLWRNDAPTGNWLQVEVPPDAFGARVEVFEADALDQPAALVGVREVVSSVGYAAGAPPLAHLGVGARTHVDVQVRLPDGRSAAIQGLPVNQYLSAGVACR